MKNVFFPKSLLLPEPVTYGRRINTNNNI